MNQLIDTIPTRRGKQDDVEKYMEWSRTAKTMQKRQMWAKVAKNTEEGVRPFPKDLEPLYAKFHSYPKNVVQREIAEWFDLKVWLVEKFMRRERMSGPEVERLRKAMEKL